MDMLAFIALVGILVTFTVPFLILKAEKKRNLKLEQHFKARTNFLGGLTIKYKGRKFYLTRISNKNMRSGWGGSYPVIIAEIKTSEKFTICNKDARKYLYLFSFPKSHVIIPTGAVETAVVAKSPEWLAKLELLFKTNNIVREAAETLLRIHFSSIQFGNETQVSISGFKNTQLFKFIGIPETVYESPETLERVLDSIISLTDALNTPITNSDQSS